MDELVDLKAQFDHITTLLDRHYCNSDLDRIKEKHASQKIYMSYFTLRDHIDNLIMKTIAEGGNGNEDDPSEKKKCHEINEKLENDDLKVLLGQTAGMNAVISAGQFNMHKKDVNDRMSSLAFKMEKVYNLDKK